jgi:hypothetical protein
MLAERERTDGRERQRAGGGAWRQVRRLECVLDAVRQRSLQRQVDGGGGIGASQLHGHARRTCTRK